MSEMGFVSRSSVVVQPKLKAALDRNADPNQARDVDYQKHIESLHHVRRIVADVLTAEKRLGLQEAQLKQSVGKLQAQAQQALQQGREDLARLALTRAETAQAQLAGLDPQITQLNDQEQKLELTAQKLQAKVAGFRPLKETFKAQ